MSMETFKCIICIQTGRSIHLCPKVRKKIYDHCSKMLFKCSCLFCSKCITIWLKSNQCCPHCRSQLAGSDLVKLNWLDEFIPKYRKVLNSIGIVLYHIQVIMI